MVGREPTASRLVFVMKPIRIIGLGNTFRSDDGAGVFAVRRLKDTVSLQAEVIEAELTGIDTLDFMKGAEAVILIDAASTGVKAGTIHRIDASSRPLPGNLFHHSTHAMNGSDALELARVLGVLPQRVIVYGIEIGDTSAGHHLSLAVEKALDSVIQQVSDDVKSLSHA